MDLSNLTLEQIQQLQAELKKKEDELKIAAIPPIEITITHFNKGTGRINVILSEVDWDVVDKLRYMQGRIYNGNSNTINAIDIPYLLTEIEKITKAREPYRIARKLVVKWDDITKMQFDQWMAQPDLHLSLREKSSQVVIEPGPKFTSARLYLSHKVQSFAFNSIAKNYTISAAEAWRLVEELDKYNTSYRIEWDENVKKLAHEQLDKRRILSEIVRAEDAPEIGSPFINGYELRPHQRVAVKFTELTGFRSLVAYGTGLGKTAIFIACIERNPDIKKCLIVCPAHLKTNWKREIRKFTGQEAVVLAGAEPDELTIDMLFDANHKYYIINYDIISRSAQSDDKGVVSTWVTVLSAVKFDAIDVDEVHYIKNTSSKRSQATMQLQAPKMMLMSADPIVNRPAELFPPLHMLDPKSYNQAASFINSFMTSDGSVKNTNQLREILGTIMIKRSFKDVYPDMAPPNRIPFTKQLSPQARINYQKVLEGIYISLRNPAFETNVTSILAQLMRCKQICSADNVETSFEIASDALVDTEKKVLIFSQFKENQAAIAKMFGNCAAVINGDIKDDARYELVDKFQDSNSDLKVVVTNILEGLTLTEAHTTIFNDLWWTPKDHNQAEGRAFGRTNDPHSGNSYYIQNENTIDELIVALLHKKMRIVEEVIDGTAMHQAEQTEIFKELINHLKGMV